MIKKLIIMEFGYEFLNYMKDYGIVKGCKITFKKCMPYIIAISSVKLLNKLV
jgi:hypothetical protein